MKPKIWTFTINVEPIPQERPRFTVSYRKGRAYGIIMYDIIKKWEKMKKW